ncbi:MAG: T9SS type A sorting domain-containing protein [Calditrichia bacterium]
MRYFTIIIFMLFSTGLFAQSTPYFPLEQGDTWLYSEFGYWTNFRNTVIGDVSMPNDKIYSEISSQWSSRNEYYRQSNDSVFVYDTLLDMEYLAYYFGADSGEIITELPLSYGDTLKITLLNKWVGPKLGRELRSWVFGFDNVGLIDDENNRTITDSLGLTSFENPHWYAYSIQGAKISGIQYGNLTSVEPESQQSDNFILTQNYPNPFNPTTTIRYQISKTANITLTIYDIAGRKIAELVNEKQAPGWYEKTLDAANLASGVYIYRLQTGERSQARKMLLVR